MKKSKTRLFINKIISLNLMICIEEKQHHFLKNVIRSKIDDKISIFDGKTGEWIAKILSINRDNTTLKVLKKNREIEKESDVWLIFAPIKQHRLNITIQKATELGISKFIPCHTNYSNNKNLNYNNLNLNIIEASEQSNRLTIPKLEKALILNDLLINYPKDRALIFCNEDFSFNISMFETINKIKHKYNKWTLLIGPEGGFSDEESKNINKIPTSIPVSLGKRVLRADTATTAALFCLQSIIELNN